jgi:hypothetical protein
MGYLVDVRGAKKSRDCNIWHRIPILCGSPREDESEHRFLVVQAPPVCLLFQDYLGLQSAQVQRTWSYCPGEATKVGSTCLHLVVPAGKDSFQLQWIFEAGWAYLEHDVRILEVCQSDAASWEGSHQYSGEENSTFRCHGRDD